MSNTIEVETKKEVIKSGFKPSPLGPIPPDWEIKHFEDVAEIDSESLRSNTSKNYRFNYISLSDVDSDDFKIETTKQVFETAPSRARRVVRKGDVLMSTVRPNLQGFSIIRDEVKDLIASTGFAVIRTNKCYNEFLFNFLFSEGISKQFYQLLVGSNYPAINSSDVKKLKIPLPSHPEQRAIAALLNTWYAAIAKQQALVAAKEQRKKWLMQQLLTGKKRLKGFSEEWKEVKMGEIISKMSNGITYDTQRTTGAPVTRIETISTGEIDFSRIGYAEITAGIEEYRLKYGDILYSHINSLEHIGKVAIKLNDDPLYHGMNLLLIRCNESMNYLFLYYWFNSSYAKKIAKNLAKQAVNQASINTSELKKIVINIPSLEEQTSIALVLRAADKELNLLKQQLEQLKEQKKGLMQVLLTGKKRLKID